MHYAQKSLHSIRLEIARWHDLLEVQYQMYKSSGSSNDVSSGSYTVYE